MTEQEILFVIGDEITEKNKNEKFAIVICGNGDYIGVEIAKRSQISIKYGCLILESPTMYSSKPLEKILNVKNVKTITI